MTAPSGLKREPWHGQSQVRSASFQSTKQPMCVQVADFCVTLPRSSRDTATAWPFNSSTLPEPRGTDRSDLPSVPAKRSRTR